MRSRSSAGSSSIFLVCGHALSFGYDALGRPLTQTGPQGTITSAFDLAGRRTRITHPDGFYVDHDYLVTGETAKIRENGATSGVGVLATFAFDDLGRRTSLTRGNGTSVSYAFDAVSRLSQLAEDMSGTNHDLTLGFGYNPASQIASNTRSNDLYAQAALPANHQTIPVDGLNRIVSVNGAATSHDARGNLTAESGRTYAYTSENLLASATHGSTTTFVYDPLMRLQRLVGASGPNFVYDGMNLTLERDAGTNAVQRRYVHGPGVDEPLVQYEGSGTSDRRFLHADERGSIVAHSDNSGAVVAINRYDEYGQPHGPSGAGTLAGRFGYTGQAWLPEAGLWYYRARMYNARLGRFLQTDPIGYGDGMNMYAYVGGDPVNFTDPSGLRSTACSRSPYCETIHMEQTINHYEISWVTRSWGRDDVRVKFLGSTTRTDPFANTGWGTRDRIELACAGPLILPCGKLLVDGLIIIIGARMVTQGPVYSRPPRDATNPTGAKAPGRPGPDEGYEPPSRGPQWGRAPNGDYGWIDAEGKIWVPTGPGPRAHGGPHWDVQDPRGGGHTNVYPGGRTR